MRNAWLVDPQGFCEFIHVYALADYKLLIKLLFSSEFIALFLLFSSWFFEKAFLGGGEARHGEKVCEFGNDPIYNFTNVLQRDPIHRILFVKCL